MNSPDPIDQQAALLNALYDGQSVEEALQASPNTVSESSPAPDSAPTE